MADLLCLNHVGGNEDCERQPIVIYPPIALLMSGRLLPPALKEVMGHMVHEGALRLSSQSRSLFGVIV